MLRFQGVRPGTKKKIINDAAGVLLVRCWLDGERRFRAGGRLVGKSAPHREQQDQQEHRYRNYEPGLPPKRIFDRHLNLSRSANFARFRTSRRA